MTQHLYLERRFRLRQIATRAVNRFARLAHQLVGFGVDTPPEAQVWAELSPDRALHRITHQAEAEFAGRGPATG